MEPKWLLWAKQIQGIAQSGRAFSKDPFDQERYNELLDLSADILATYGDVDTEVVKALFAKESGYQTPKVDVRGVIFQHGKILLVREKAEQKWSLPGGFCDVDCRQRKMSRKRFLKKQGFVRRQASF